MTLDTRVYFNGGTITAEELFDKALKAILLAADRIKDYTSAIVERTTLGDLPGWIEEDATDDMKEGWRYRHSSIRTSIGQGLPAITAVSYMPDNTPLLEVGGCDICDDDDSDAHGCRYTPAHHRSLSWDTGYGYNHNGDGCSDLHAKALMILRNILPEDVQMWWRDEYTGDVYYGVSEYLLENFTRDGLNASEWFTGEAMPAISRLLKVPVTELES